MASSLSVAEERMPLQELQELERRASRVVSAIEKCMGLTRNIEEFNKIAPAALWSAVNNSPKNKVPVGAATPNDRQLNTDPKAVIESFDLLAHLEKKGMGAAAVKTLCGTSNNSTSFSRDSDSNPRRAVVYEIIQPLAEALRDCYAQLDRIPTQPAIPPPTQRGKSKKPPPPLPPPGMLSLQNYTDIGAFFELWVCTSVLPLIEPCILFAVEDRARYFLPKSLAGRISRPTLLWGCRQEMLQTVKKGNELEALQRVVQELQSTVVILGSALLLDRFRPMLLPRHLADIYAAIFQAEVYTKRIRQLSQQQQRSESANSTAVVNIFPALAREYQEVIALLLPPATNVSESDVATTSIPHALLAPVNTALQAQSLQTLLLQGTKTPMWLRQRVATRLTDIACQNLSVIIQVFVHAAPPKDKTAASLRLARTLVTSKTGTSTVAGEEQGQYYDRLCGQVVQVLDDITNECHRGNLTCGNTNHLTLKQSLDIHTVWTILDQLPAREMQPRMLSSLSEGMIWATNNDNMCIHRSVNRIANLMAAIPPSLNPCKLTEVLLMPLADNDDSLGGTKPTILGQLLRLAALQPAVLKSRFRDDVVLTLRLVLQLVLSSKFNSVNTNTETGAMVAIDEAEVASMTLLYAVAPSNWDISGKSYSLKSDAPNQGSQQFPGFDYVEIMQAQGSLRKTEDLVAAVERRVKVILGDLLSPLIQASSSTSNKDDKSASQRKAEGLPSVVFHLVIRMYFSSIQSGAKKQSVDLPDVFRQSSCTSAIGMFRVVSMCFLPLLCESCPLDHLLRSSESDATGIFRMMQLVFACAGAYFTSENTIFLKPSDDISPEATQPESTDGSHGHFSFHQSGQYFSGILEARTMEDDIVPAKLENTTNVGEADIGLMDVEMLLSVTTLLLTLLIAIVELGSNASRSPDEEVALGSFIALLRPLAELSDTSWMHRAETPVALATSSAEMAEMAGHAMALLAARTAPSRKVYDMATSEQMAPKETIEKFLQQAKMDLDSIQPPVRARGVVSLQHFLRGDLFQKLLLKEAIPPSRSPLIIDLDESNKAPRPQPASNYAINGILQCAIYALSDSESYVYLAAVQSIVAAADTCPRKVLPSIALSVASGVFAAQELQSEGAAGETKLSPAQQIKLSEALVFCIRRRARLDEFTELLLDLMIFGDQVDSKDSTEVHSDYDKVLLIHKETQQYFLHGRAEENNEDEDFKEQLEKQNVRFNTGGPLFCSEERDVVTAGRVAVISELVSTAHPSTLAKYCHLLVRTATETLRLDVSRPVRRAAAFLTREFYRTVLREQVELFEMVGSSMARDDRSNETDLAFTSALVSSTGDEILASVLERCLAADDLNDISKGKHRKFDPATAARCQEALEARQEAVDGGVFVVAKLVAEAKRQRNSLPVATLIRELLKPKSHDQTNIEALRGLRIDPNTLELS